MPENGTELHDHYGLVGDCAGCGGQMIETTCLDTSEERRATLECQDCGAEAELRHDFEDGLKGGSWSGVGNPEFKPLNWIQCPRCYGHGYVEDPICDLRRAMNGREHPCPNCHTSGKVPRVVETDGGIKRPAVCVDTLDYDGAETHEDSIEGEVTRHYYSCPNCDHPISTWMDCPECLWYDEDVWTRTVAERGESA